MVVRSTNTRTKLCRQGNSMKMPVLFFCMSVVFTFLLLSVATEHCKPTRCSKGGPRIQYPFRDKHLHRQECGYPGFDVYCNKKSETMIKLPVSVEVSVKKIDYTSQKLHLYDPGRCLPQKLQHLNLSASPFHFLDIYLTNYTLFNCSSDLWTDRHESVPCLGGPGHRVYAVNSDLMSDLFTDPYSSSSSLSSCNRIQEILFVPSEVLNTEVLHLGWYKPACSKCEARGPLRVPLIAGPIVGSLILVAALGALFYFYCRFRAHKENRMKIEKFLDDYKALNPTRFTYADIRRITNHFHEKLGQGGYGTVYKGKLSDEVYVAVKVLSNTKGNGEEFTNEVSIIGRIHHVNVVHLVGFCAEGVTRALVYEFLQNGSLEKFIFHEGSKRLTVEKLQDIAIGIAKGIEYLHLGCDQQILHFDIKPQNILLDSDFNPKISDFGLAKLCSKEQSSVTITSGRGTIGYIAPEVVSRAFGRVSYKSDIYSYGMVLIEMVGMSTYEDTDMNPRQEHFLQWIYDQLNQNQTTVQITEGAEYKLRRKLTVVGLWCIQWAPADRPSMKAVVQMLEGAGDDLTMPPNPFLVQMQQSLNPRVV